MFGEGFDMNSLLQQAQAMQEQLQRAQAEQAARTFTASAGGDLVSVELSGTGDLTGLTIKPEACDPTDTDGLADLIVAAFRAAKAQADAALAASMPQIPGLGL
ncbi:MAG: YbaB/EbfC family nucleoid-associated protein [Propionibacteriaceae bacterium]|nr:YbaB/EbfC family nucleoid-associated protein [Propionibacteriaceae bacterium]